MITQAQLDEIREFSEESQCEQMLLKHEVVQSLIDEIERLRKVETLLANLAKASGDMLIGIGCHNALSWDAPARKHDIKGQVVTAFSEAIHKAKVGLTPTKESR